jgi:glycerophosphoryl diester phosphodiesterase
VGMVDSKYSLCRELNRGINWLFTNRAAAVKAYLQDF